MPASCCFIINGTFQRYSCRTFMAFFINRAGFLKTGVLGIFLLAGCGLQAALLTYSAEFPAMDPMAYQATPWDQTFSLPQFDPHLGRLEGVTILLEAAISVTQ